MLLIVCSSANLHAISTVFVSECLATFQGRLDEAGPLFERSLAILEKVLGPDHPGVAMALNNWAELLKAQVRAVMVFQDTSCGT